MRGRKIEQCGVVLLNKRMDKVLIVLQKESQKWGLPKGHMSPDEIERLAYFECAKRELFEETGIWLSFVRNKTIGTLIFQDKLFYMVQINRDELWTQPIDRFEIERTMWLEVAQLGAFVKGERCNSTLSRLAHEINTMWATPTYNHRMLYALPVLVPPPSPGPGRGILHPPPGFEHTMIRSDIRSPVDIRSDIRSAVDNIRSDIRSPVDIRSDIRIMAPPPGFEHIVPCTRPMTPQQLQVHVACMPFAPIMPYTTEWYTMQCALSNVAPISERIPYSSLPIHLQGLPFVIRPPGL